MPTLEIDGKQYEVAPGDNLLHACLTLGFDLPYFCWHPALGSVGACRQCAVKEFRGESDTRGRITMACMTPANDGMRISIEDSEAHAFRASVIEWLMTNHPHDCPVCEEGGECHLQDMTLMSGHVHRRYRFKKRTFTNQYLGPFLTHEMNRCIACYRCVRFYRDYAGGRDLDVFAIHRNVYFGRHKDGVLENEFSGNLAEICPTGVFDDKPFSREFARKWDLSAAPSICIHCGVGCNVTLNERSGKVRRVLNRFNNEINGYFLCDRGRFGYGFVNDPARIRKALWRSGRDAEPQPISRQESLRRFQEILARGKAIGIGSSRASIEANFALRELVGSQCFFYGVPKRQKKLIESVIDILREGPAPAASLREVEQSDAVFVLGEDVSNTAPRVALAVRQAVRARSFQVADDLKIPRWQDAAVRTAAENLNSPLFIASSSYTRLDDIATHCHRAVPSELARLGFAVAHQIDNAAPNPADLADDTRVLAEEIASALRQAKRPLIVSGSPQGSISLIRAAANIAWSIRRKYEKGALYFTLPECNSMGLGLIGGNSLSDAFAEIERGGAETLIILEHDLYRTASRANVETSLNDARNIVVIDHYLSETARKATLVLPAATFSEADGTLINSEGRAQRYFQVVASDGDAQESWRWISQAKAEATVCSWEKLDDVTVACAKAIPALAGIVDAAPSAEFRVAGCKIARQPRRYSGRTAVSAEKSVHEPKPPDDPDTPFTYSMEGYYGVLPAPLIPYFWAPKWNSAQSLNKFQSEVGGALKQGNPGRRLVEPAAHPHSSYFRSIPAVFRTREDQLLVFPLHEIFGAEELSAMSDPIRERIPDTYLIMNPEDATSLHLTIGQIAAVALKGSTFRLPITLSAGIPKGAAGTLVGSPDSVTEPLPAWGRIWNPNWDRTNERYGPNIG